MAFFAKKSTVRHMILALHPTHWNDYELIDSGAGEKLERFGKYVLRRPEPQAVWRPAMQEQDWKRLTDARFVPEGSANGRWEKRQAGMEEQWYLDYPGPEGLKLRFRLALTGFKHVGIFPEQAANWDFTYQQCSRISGAKVLNLFAYTGGASLAARAAGADVIHCDSIKQVVNWARQNMEASGLQDIRWLVEDAFKFVQREARRGNRYHGVILDPPAWGHGPKGERWKLEDMIDELMAGVSAILEPRRRFLVFNAYSLGYSPLILQNLVHSHMGPDAAAASEIGELYLPEHSGRRLPAGVFARFAQD